MDARMIGAYISDLRKERNMTQIELSQKLHVSHQAVSKWERGESLPDISILPALANVFGITIDNLLNGRQQPVPTAAIESDATAAEEQSEPEDSGIAHASMSVEQLIGLAPFVSQDVLESMAERLEITPSLHALIGLAPFLTRATLERLVASVQESVDGGAVVGLAPFLGSDSLDHLVLLADEHTLDWRIAQQLAPFIHSRTLTRLCEWLTTSEQSIDPHQLIGLAPFLEQSDLDELASSVAGSLHPNHLFALAPFLSQAAINRLVLHRMG